jgi:hypothetical protein
MASDNKADVTYGGGDFKSPWANTELAFDASNISWDATEALYPLEGCQVSLIPPSADVGIRNNNIWFTAENPYGDSSFGIIGSTGSHFSVDEKGTIQVKAASPVSEDMTCGRIEIESQTNCRLNVGTSLAINVNASGQHDEEGDVSNSSTQSVDKKRYPAFSINVSNGGLDIECADGDIFFSGKNITMNAAETLTLNATRAVNILSGYEPTQVAAAALGGLFGFELPDSGGGEVVIKAGKFKNDSTTIETNAVKNTEKTTGAKTTETGSPMGTNSVRQSGDLSLATSGNVWIAAGQKMRIEAQGTVVNPTGPAVPPIWGSTQLENLVIAVNKGNTPGKTVFKTEVHNGDWVTTLLGKGNAAIATSAGFIGLVGGRGDAETLVGKPGDILLDSMSGSLLGTAKLDAKFKGIKSAELGIGEEKVSTDFLKFEPKLTTLTVTKPMTVTGTGTLTSTLTGDFKNTITGAITNTITGAITTTQTGAYTNTITGATTETITGAYKKTITGATSFDVTGAFDIKSSGAVKITGTTVDIDGPSGINLN